MKLQDRVCVVTGGARGIGEAIAPPLRRRGRDRRGVGRRRRGRGRRGRGARGSGTRATCQPARGRGRPRPNARAPRPHRRAREQRRGGSRRPVGDVLGRRLGHLDRHDADRRLPVLAGRRAGTCSTRLRLIVNISSINAWDAFPMRLAYCAAKAAVVAMTEVLAIEWADRGVRVNAVAPG